MLVEAGRHVFDMDELDIILSSQWIATLDKNAPEILRKSSQYSSFTYAPINPVVLIDRETREGGEVDFQARLTRAHPLDALRFLTSPFLVIVENEWYDGGFLLWMAKALNFQQFISAYRNRLFQFRHAGGKGELSRSSEVMSNGVWPRSDGAYSQALRLWNGVMLDNDSEYPGHDPNGIIRDSCSPHSAWVRQLSCRSIENFIPKSSMLKFLPAGEEQTRVHAYFRMTEKQRQHYNMKRGFRFPGNTVPTKTEYMASMSVNPAAKQLYQSVPNEDWRLLSPGFGGSLSKIYVNQDERPNPGQVQLATHSLATEVREILEQILRST